MTDDWQLKVTAAYHYCPKNMVSDGEYLWKMGENGIAIRRWSNRECVDVFSGGKKRTWYCIDYVRKHPEIFKPIPFCKIGTTPFTPKKILKCKPPTLKPTKSFSNTTLSLSGICSISRT